MCDACQHPETDDWIQARLHGIVTAPPEVDAILRRHWPRKPELLV